VLDALDGDTGQHQMKLVYVPQGGSDAQVQIWLDDTLAAVHPFSGDWDNSLPFEVLLSGMARATDTDNGAPVGHDMVDAAFDNLNVSILTAVPEPSSIALVALGCLGLGLAAARRRWRRSA